MWKKDVFCTSYADTLASVIKSSLEGTLEGAPKDALSDLHKDAQDGALEAALKGSIDVALEMHLLLHLLMQSLMHKRLQNISSNGGHDTTPQGVMVDLIIHLKEQLKVYFKRRTHLIFCLMVHLRTCDTTP